MDGGSKILNGSCDVTTPLSGTICPRWAGTSYDQPVYQIRNHYVHLLERYEKQQ